MIVARREALPGRIFLVLLMAVTVVPFVSLFVTALHPSGTYPSGLSWPSEPRWGNFAAAFEAAHLGDLLQSSVLIVLGVVPVSLVLSTMAGFAIGHLRIVGRRLVFLVFVLGLTLPFEGIITPLYYQVRDLGLLNTRSVGNRHPTPVRRIPADPDAHARRLRQLPAPLRLRPPARLVEGLRARAYVRHSVDDRQACV